MILVGTAGFRYADWKGPFYPPGTREADFLSFYARHFNVVELDFTYYRMPVARTMKGLAERTPPGFEFCVKANRTMTHEIPGEGSRRRDTFTQFMEAMEPLRSAGRFGCILAQFPYSFKPSAESLDYLAEFKELCGGAPVVVEYRNSQWVSEKMFGFMRDAGLGFCCVDEPRLAGLMPPVVVATSSIAYVRFHGRNAAKWWKHDHASERYDYLYSEEELQEWAPKVRKLDESAGKTYVLFNNCHEGKAARNSLMMQDLLGIARSGAGRIELPGLQPLGRDSS